MVGLLVALLSAGAAPGQVSEKADWAAFLGSEYVITPNVTYLKAENYEAKLDLYLPSDSTVPSPVLVYFHGGGWRLGTKENDSLLLLPYLEMGFAVLNVEYRLTQVSLAPAAVEDCRCALRWVFNQAGEHNLDSNRIVVSGISAGATLALNAAFLTSEDGLDTRCPGPEMPVAAVINWLGITDLHEQIVGPNRRTYAIAWLGGQAQREEIAKLVSPIRQVRRGGSPVLTIHGDADPIVPYSQALRLHEALDRFNIPNRLLTIAGGGHGGFTRAETVAAFTAIREFLTQHHLLNPTATTVGASR